MSTEIWRDIKDYEGVYQVSNWIRVKSLERTITVTRKYGVTTRIVPERILVTGLGNGYNTVSLWKNNKGRTHKISVLAATAFIPNPTNLPIVNHLDGIKTNDSLGNYEWTNHRGNAVHAEINGLTDHARGKDSGAAKLSEKYVRDIRLITNKSNRQIAKEYGVGHATINAIKSRKTWRHIA